MIKMTAIGHLGKDATVNNVNGKNVINFTVAHSEKYKDQSGKEVQKTVWVDCSYWTDKTAVAPYLKKGTQVYVEGTPEARSFQRQDNTCAASLNCRVFSLQLLGGQKQEQGAVQQASPVEQSGPVTDAQAQEAASNGLPF